MGRLRGKYRLSEDGVGEGGYALVGCVVVMSHFIYQHLPATGLGIRNPRRPHVTGGLGGPTFSYSLRMRSSTTAHPGPIASTVEGVRP